MERVLWLHPWISFHLIWVMCPLSHSLLLWNRQWLGLPVINPHWPHLKVPQPSNGSGQCTQQISELIYWCFTNWKNRKRDDSVIEGRNTRRGKKSFWVGTSSGCMGSRGSVAHMAAASHVFPWPLGPLWQWGCNESIKNCLQAVLTVLLKPVQRYAWSGKKQPPPQSAPTLHPKHCWGRILIEQC